MALFNILEFSNESSAEEPVFNPEIIPEELDIFYRQIKAFLPEGKTLEDLTPEELAKARAQYRFDPMRPGIYQGISGFQGMI